MEIAAGVSPEDRFEGVAALPSDVTRALYPYGRLTRRFSGSPRLLRHVLATCRRFDAVHVHSVWNLPSYVAAWIAVLLRVRLVISPHGSLEPYDLRKHAGAKRLLGPLFVRPLLSRAHVVLCTTEREADQLTTYGATVRTAVLTLPSFGGPAHAEHLTRPADEARELLFLGRLDPKKGVEVLLETMERLPPDVRLTIAGDGEPAYADGLRALGRSDALADRVRFVGWLTGEQKASAYAAADLFVLLSYNENFGITVMEAAEHGVPVVLTTEVYAGQALVDEGAAVLATHDPDEAATVITGLLADAQRREAMSAAGVRLAAQDREALDASYSALLG